MRNAIVMTLVKTVTCLAFWLVAFSAAAQPMTAIRLSHLSPDSPAVDLVVDRQLFLRDVEYGQVTPYRALPAGQHEISVYPHRLPDDSVTSDGSLALEPITMLVDLAEGAYYTLSVSGFYQGPAEEGTGGLAIDVEPPEALVLITGPRGFSRSFTGQLELEGLEPGDYNLRATAPGYAPATFATEVRSDETTTVGISLQQGEEGVAEETDRLAGAEPGPTWRPVELHAFRDEFSEPPPPGGSRVRLIHLSPSTQAVDLLAIPTDQRGDPVVLASGLTFPNASSYARLPGHEYTLQIRLAGSDAILSQVEELSIEPGGVYTLFLVREPEDNFLRLVPAVDLLLHVRR